MIVDLLSRGGGHHIHSLVSDTAARRDALDGPQAVAGNRCSVAGGW